MGARRSHVALAVICGIAVAGAATMIGFALRPVPPPDVLGEGSAEVSAPVVEQRFDDARKVQVKVVMAKPDPLAIHATGTVTASQCSDASALVSGALALRVDDEPIIALHTTVPFFRDLAWEMEGADVEALQMELVRLGYLAGDQVDGNLGWNTTRAFQLLRKKATGQDGEHTIRRSEVLWLPAPELTGLTCEAKVGQTVTDGAPFATVGGSVERVVVESLPDNLVPGERTLTLQRYTGVLSDDGASTDPKLIQAISKDTKLISALQEAPDTTLTASIALSEARTAYKLPVGSLIGTSDHRCVQSGQKIIPVRVLGSTLGSALVSFAKEQTPPAAVNIGAKLTEARCDSQ